MSDPMDEGKQDQSVNTVPQEPISLADYDVVASLVGVFANDIAAISDCLACGEATPEETKAAIEARVNIIAAIFNGETEGFIQAEWNAEGRLAGRIIGWGIHLDGMDPIAGFFSKLAIKVMNAVRAVNDGMAEEEAGPIIQWDIRDAVDRLTGVRP